MQVKNHIFFQGATAPATSGVARGYPMMTFHHWGRIDAGTGVISASIDVSNDGTNWHFLGSLNVTADTTGVNTYRVENVPWGFVRVRLNLVPAGAESWISMGYTEG